MIAAANAATTYGGWVFGLLASLFAAVGWLGGTYRKSVAEARNQDIETLVTHGELQDKRIAALEVAVKECEARDKAKELVISNLSSQIRAADKLDLVAAGVTELLARGGKGG